MKINNLRNHAPIILFVASLSITSLGLAFGYGIYSYKHTLFPIPQAKAAVSLIKELFNSSDRFLVNSNLKYDGGAFASHPDRLAPGLLMIGGILEGRDAYVRIIDRSGTILHEWTPVWSEIWPANEGDFPAGRRPSGMYLHGVDILPDASIVANFEFLSTFRMDICGKVKWKLDNLGHHSVHYSDQGDLWVTAERYIASGSDTGYPGHASPLRSWSVQKIGETGEILQEIEVVDLLRRNDLDGLLFLFPDEKGDTLHLNDVDIFPADLASEVFEPGDVMISLRNINTVLVFDPDTLEVKFVSTGRVLAQHDPDFLPGDIISVFDNHNRITSSRIVEIDARTGSTSVVLDGSGEDGFFTGIMGAHQRLDNGNILVSSTRQGHALEYLPDGQLGWRYVNRISPDQNGNIFLAKLLPEDMDEAFFTTHKAQCQ